MIKFSRPEILASVSAIDTVLIPMNDFQRIYSILHDFYGPQRWWPADTDLEMIVGAVLTQNTNWKNVEKAIGNLKRAGVLSLDTLSCLSIEDLASHIRSVGYYNLKAKRLKNLLKMIEDEYEGELQQLLADDLSTGRNKLLAVKGVGEETADSILLYAGDQPVFVVDAYTHRVFSRHNLVPEECSYADIQQSFMDSLPTDPKIFNEYHALIVRLAKDFCKKSAPLCEGCPLQGI